MSDRRALENREALKRLFAGHGVVLAYLFGSQAEGTAGPLSDLDFAVLRASFEQASRPRALAGSVIRRRMTNPPRARKEKEGGIFTA